jgi:xanthine/uracil permease
MRIQFAHTFVPYPAMRVGMNLSAFLAIGSIIGLLYGAAFLLAPEGVLAAYGMQSNPAAILGYRYFGVALLTIAVLAWLIRYSTDWIALRSVLIGYAVGNVAGVLVSIWGTLSGIMNPMGWSAVLIYGVLLAGDLYYLRLGPGQSLGRYKWSVNVT